MNLIDRGTRRRGERKKRERIFERKRSARDPSPAERAWPDARYGVRTAVE